MIDTFWYPVPDAVCEAWNAEEELEMEVTVETTHHPGSRGWDSDLDYYGFTEAEILAVDYNGDDLLSSLTDDDLEELRDYAVSEGLGLEEDWPEDDD